MANEAATPQAEFMNPGGSVKDRAAWGLVQWAEKTGEWLCTKEEKPGRRPNPEEDGSEAAGTETAPHLRPCESHLTVLSGLQARSSLEEPSSKALLETRALDLRALVLLSWTD
jgi:hypothetical protein